MDGRIKHHVINAIAKDLTEKSINKVKSNTTLLRGIFDPAKQHQLLRQTFPKDTIPKTTSSITLTTDAEKATTDENHDTQTTLSSSSANQSLSNKSTGEERTHDLIFRTPSKSYQKEDMQQYLASKHCHSLSSASGGIYPTASVDYVQELSADEILSAVENDGQLLELEE